MNRKTAKKYGLKVVTQCGVDYAICPNPDCNNGYLQIEDALKCCSQEPDDVEEISKVKSMELVSKVQPKEKYAIISAFKHSAEKWRLDRGLKKDSCVWVNEDNYQEIDDSFNIVFAGNRKDDLSLWFVTSPLFWRELQIQESEREFKHYVLYEDDGGKNGTPIKFLIPYDKNEELEALQKLIPKDRINPTFTALKKNFMHHTLIYTPENIAHNLRL